MPFFAWWSFLAVIQPKPKLLWNKSHNTGFIRKVMTREKNLVQIIKRLQRPVFLRRYITARNVVRPWYKPFWFSPSRNVHLSLLGLSSLSIVPRPEDSFTDTHIEISWLVGWLAIYIYQSKYFEQFIALPSTPMAFHFVAFLAAPVWCLP